MFFDHFHSLLKSLKSLTIRKHSEIEYGPTVLAEIRHKQRSRFIFGPHYEVDGIDYIDSGIKIFPLKEGSFDIVAITPPGGNRRFIRRYYFGDYFLRGDRRKELIRLRRKGLRRTICLQCRGRLADNGRYCPHCGIPQKPVKISPARPFLILLASILLALNTISVRDSPVEPKQLSIQPSPSVSPIMLPPADVPERPFVPWRDDKAKSKDARKYIRGPLGGCYYNNSNGNKTYVNRSFCNNFGKT